MLSFIFLYSSSSLGVLFLVVIHISSGERNVRRRRQLSPPLPEKYSVYVKPLPANNKQTQLNKPFLSFAQEQNQPFQLPLKKQNQPQERSEFPLPQYDLPLSPQSQTNKWTQSSSVEVSYISTEPQLQYQLPIQPLQSHTPQASQIQPSQIRPNYQVPSQSSHELPPQFYSHHQPRFSSHTKPQLYNSPTQIHYQLSAQPSRLQSQNHQPKNYQLESLQSGNSEQENPQIVLMNGQAFVMNSKQTQTPDSSQENHQSHSSHAILSSSTTDAVFQDKLVTSIQPQLQSVIQKTPASEIDYSNGNSAKDKDNSEDIYVMYYYYYYEDAEKATNNTNSSLKFDDIPNLDNYDQAKNESSFENDEKINSPIEARNVPATGENNTFLGASSLRDRSLDQEPGSLTFNNTDQSKSVDASSRNFKESNASVRPISNVYRYGNDVPRFPLAPNLVDYSNKRQSSSLYTNISVEDKKEQVPVDLTVRNASSFTSPGEVNILDSVHTNDTVIKSNEILEVNTEPLTKNIESTETETATETESTITTDIITTTKAVPTRFNNRIRFGSGRLPGSFQLRKPPILALTTTTTKKEPEKETNGYEESTTTASRISRFRPRFGSGKTSIAFSRRRSSFGNKSRFGIFKNDNSDNKKDGDEKDVHKYGNEESTTTLSTAVAESSQSTTRRNFRNSQSTTSRPTNLISRILPSNIFSRSRSRPRLPFLRRGRNNLRRGKKVEEISDEDEKPEEEEEGGELKETTLKTDNKTVEEETLKREDDKGVRKETSIVEVDEAAGEEKSRGKEDKAEEEQNSKEVEDQAEEEEDPTEGEFKEKEDKAVEGEQYKEEEDKAVEGEQYKEEGDKAVGGEQYKEEGDKAVGGEQYKEEGDKAEGGEQYKEEGDKVVGGEQYNEEGDKAVEGEQYKEEGDKAVEGEQYKKEGDTAVEGEQYKEEGYKAVEGEQYKEEEDKAVEEEKQPNEEEDKAVEGEKYKEEDDKEVEGEKFKEGDRIVEEKQPNEEEDKTVEKVNEEGGEAVEKEKYEVVVEQEQQPLKVVPSISTTGATTTFTLFTTPSREVETTTVIKDLDEITEVETEKIQTTTETLTTTTERNRFSSLFRKRKRPSLFGNRPRLTIFNRSG
ncbi:uncharacterized protein LOC106470053 [Limulus polyphemus]|uniref:Uncharacterized protein LOC106470053 n=1 Tax=Limulus polyphemus TaxID=6850 RepID=A0ABM1BPA5_LIMPO|nr:uncharacterized protein LOC106470053 [Limulus polyphemus]